MNNFNKLVNILLTEYADNTASSASMFGTAAATAAANTAMQGDVIYNPNNSLPVAPSDLALGKKRTKRGRRAKIKIQRRVGDKW